MKLRWKPGDAVRLAAEERTHLGRLAANTPGTVIRLEFGPRVLVRFAAGDVWVDGDRLLSAQHAIDEAML